MPTILVCAVPTPGHVLPLRLIARHLEEQGHAVRFLTGALFADMVQADGFGFGPLCPHGDCDYRDPTFEVPAAGAGGAVAVDYNALPPGDAQIGPGANTLLRTRRAVHSPTTAGADY